MTMLGMIGPLRRKITPRMRRIWLYDMTMSQGSGMTER